ncbi:Transcription initiation factor TFIID subunit 10 [Puttea exsequens]|nr:Transcription initiation factor TFIID subunit 10 [Puttea exsequens]
MASSPPNPLTQPPETLDTEMDGDPQAPAIQPSNPDIPTLPEPREATKKDITLKEFLSKMDDHAPIIPDAVTAHHLLVAGLPPHSTPLPLQRLLALATQKFIADIAADAYQYSRMRTSATGAGQPAAAAATAAAMAGGLGGGQEGGQGAKGREEKRGQHVLGVQRAGYGGGGGGGGQGGRAVLTMEDLGCAVGEYGVNVKRGEFYR